MPEPTLQQIFGENASQNNDSLIISKRDLTSTGLTILSSNTAESLVVALLGKWSQYLSENNLQNNVDIQITLEIGSENIVTLSNTTTEGNVINVRKRKRIVTINLYRPFNTNFDPDYY